MNRIDVYALINGERHYQAQRHELVNAVRPHRDEDHHVADWLCYMEHHLELAKKAVYMLDTNKALSNVRKVTALGVACMEFNNTPARSEL